jgi:ABC-type Mn2+/Zn2+ transport system ATPase subunit/ABC-type branched-subunit amino acid transport system permease subunit
MIRRLLLLAAGAVVVAFVYPTFASAPNLDRAAVALALAGSAAGAAVATAAGRPPLMAAALAGVGAYVSGLLALHGFPVPVSVVIGAGAGAVAGALVALLCARLDGASFLVATLLLAVAGGAAVQALPAITGAQSGLGPLPPLSLPLSANKSAVLTPLGDFHALLAAATLSAALAALMLWRGFGPGWRAVGSDRARAAASGLRPLVSDATALALAGLLAALSGALAAHVTRLASPDSFAPDVAALPLLAALAAGRDPIGAAAVAVGTGLVGVVILPAAGWQGPPDAMSLAIGTLAIAALFTLLPGGARQRDAPVTSIDATTPWPLDGLGLRGARVVVPSIQVHAANGELLVDSPGFSVEPGAFQAVVGPNGAGKTTLLTAILARAGPSGDVIATAGEARGRVVLLPQEGGGFAACSVRETLLLGARPGRSAAGARALAEAWLHRLGLEASADTLCVELSGGQRRLVDLARVLLGAPNVLLCDEPLAGLDDGSRAAASACLRAAAQAGLTIIVAEHDRDAVAALATGVIALERADAVQRPARASL